jgi:integrase
MSVRRQFFSQRREPAVPRYGMNIYKRKDGRFEGRYIKSRIGDKVQYGYVYARNYNEVKSKLQAAKATAHHANGLCSTTGEYLFAWLEKSKPALKESTYMLYYRTVENHLAPLLGPVNLRQITADHISPLIFAKSHLAPKTLHGIVGVLNCALSDAAKQNLIPFNPCKNIKLPQAARKKIRVFTPQQQQRVEAACDIGILICLYTGIRIGELCALKWGDVDFGRGVLYVHSTVQRIQKKAGKAGTKIVTTPPKTSSSDRHIPLPQFLTDKLAAFRQAPEDYIVSVNGKGMEPRTYQYRFKKLLWRLGLPEANFHTLRHTFSTRALELGFDVKTLSEILGHNNASITLGIYAHSIMEHKRAQMNLLCKLQKERE